MSSPEHEVAFGNIADRYLSIDCSVSLSPSLIASVSNFCENVEEAGESTVGLIHLRGTTGMTSTQPWPGNVEIHLVNKWERALRRLERADAVTIAAAEGECYGPAFEVMLAADYRVATRDLRLRIPVRSGDAWPSMALYRLASQFGASAARRLILFPEELTATQAEQVGLLDESVDDLREIVRARVLPMRARNGSELAIRRRLLLDAAATSFEDALGTHLAACDRALRRSPSWPPEPAPAVAAEPA